MKRISRKVREEAALIAAAMASNELHAIVAVNVAASVGASQSAIDLYWEAWSYAQRDSPYEGPDWYGSPIYDAEAEALLRTGWSPS